MNAPRNSVLVLLISAASALAVDPYAHCDAVTTAIHLGVCAAEPPSPGSTLFAMDSKLCWNSGKVLSVQFMDGTESDAEFVMSTAAEWSQHAAITFDRVPKGGEIRITFLLPGFSSQIGKGALDVRAPKPTMRLGFAPTTNISERRRVVLHEFGHALGFAHEQASPEADIRWRRDEVIAYFQKWYGWNREKTELNVLRKVRAEDAPRGLWSPFDRYSIMLYPIPKELVEPGSLTQTLNRELSALDKQKAAFFYPRAVAR
jgi:Astacin (Peptidase family M12A)